MRVLILIIVLMWPLAAFGQSQGASGAETEAKRVETFQKLFERAAQAYNEGEFGQAATLFQKAYAVQPEAAALYNAARAAQKMGNFEQALSLSKDAAAAEDFPLPAPLEQKNAELQDELRAQIDEKKAREAAAAQKGLDVRGWSGVATAGVGVVGIFVGTQVFGPRASDAADRARDAEYVEEYQRHIDDQEAAQGAGWAFVYSGSALVLVGAGLVTWDLLDNPEGPSVSVGPKGPAGSTGAFLRVNF
jgi:tetratricopeptide (TPR) repeat protein